MKPSFTETKFYFKLRLAIAFALASRLFRESQVSSGRGGNNHPNPLRAIWTTDPNRPVYSALLEAEFQRADKLFDGTLDKEAAQVKNASEANKLFEDYAILLQEATEILKWVFPQQQKSFGFILSTAKIMKDVGLPEDMIRSFMGNAEHKPRGRPITKRQIAIQALEKQMLEPERKWSYRQLAQMLCNCGKEKHDQSCGQNLRQSMIKLKSILARYAPHLPVNKSE